MSPVIRRVFLEDIVQAVLRNPWTGIFNIDAVGVVAGSRILKPSFTERSSGMQRVPRPNTRESPDFDFSSSWREFAGVIEEIDEYLFNLSGFEIQHTRNRIQVHGNGNLLTLGKWIDFMQRLLNAFSNVRLVSIRLPLHLTSDAQIEHG